MGLAALPPLPSLAARDAGIALALEQATLAMISSYPLDEVLVRILDCCPTVSRNAFAATALLEPHGDLLEGSLLLSTETRRAIDRTNRTLGGLWQTTPRAANQPLPEPSISIPVFSQPISLPVTDSENLAVRAFCDREAYDGHSFYDLVRPRIARPAAAAIQTALKIETIVVLPLSAGGECLGVLAFAPSTEGCSGEFDPHALNALRNLIAATIASARLKQALGEREQQVSLLLKATIDAQEEERERICLEIHDGVAQTLAPAFQYLQMVDSRSELSPELLATTRKAASLVRTAIREAREVIATLRPAALDTLGLVSTLRHEMDELRSQTGWLIEFEADRTRFPKTTETALYRIIREAVTNVRRHARADRLSLLISQDRDRIVAEVRDNGVGFNPDSLDSRVFRKGVGLLSMRKRAELLGGFLSVASGPGKGTMVRVIVPLLAVEERGNSNFAG